MKRTGVRWAVILIVFIVSLVVSNIILNQGSSDLTIEMQEATLPVISVLYDGNPVNTMRGYTRRMDNGTIRDCISPIGDDRTLSYIINSYGTDVSRIRYEVRSVDGSRLIENTNVNVYEEYHSEIIGSISIRDLIEDEKEYNLCFILTLADGKEAYYYTRIIRDDIDVASKISFVTDFNNKTFDSEFIDDIAKYMETSSEGDNTTLARVDIHSNKGQLGWGTMFPRKFGETVTTIHEIDSSTAGISLDYMVSVRSQNVNSIYRVEEYYRIRQSHDRFYLISFDRNMTQVFDVTKDSFVNNKVMLGIQAKGETELAESEDGNIVAFVNDGRLFSYDISANRFATLCAFYNAGDSDLRNIYRNSSVKILDVEENGNITFIIYGYMNRGIHEGRVGVDVKYFDSVLNTIEELAFIEYDKSPQILQNDVSKVSHINNFGSLYMCVDGNIISYNLDDMTVEVVSDAIREDTFYVSNSNQTAVWQESNYKDITADMYVLDLKDGYLSVIEKKNSECIKPIGFMNEDLVYGISRKDEVIVNPLGDVTFHMDRLQIRSELGELLKDYDFEGIYVTQGNIVDNQICLKRVTKDENGRFVETYDDQIINNVTAASEKNIITYAVTDMFETIAQIELKKNIETRSLKFLTPKEVLSEGGMSIETPKVEELEERYFLYYNGHIIDIKDDPGMNVGQAATLRGTIVDSMGHEIYRRGETVARNQIMAIKEDSMTKNATYMADCLNTILRQRGISRNTEYMLSRGDTPIDILTDNLTGVHILNLTGSPGSAIIYYLDQDIPVLAIAEDRPILLTGYNEQEYVWYDPAKQSIYKMGIKDSQEIFEAAGNRFLTYSIAE